MNCGDWEKKLTDFALEEATTAEQAQIESHLAGCASCRAELEEIRATTGMLREELAGEPSSSLSVEQRQDLLSNRKRRLAPFGISWNKAAMAAGALIGISTLIFIYAADELSFEPKHSSLPPKEGDTPEIQLTPSMTRPERILFAEKDSAEIQAAPIPVDAEILTTGNSFAPFDSIGAGASGSNPQLLVADSSETTDEEQNETVVVHRRSYGGAFGGRRNLVARKETPALPRAMSGEFYESPEQSFPGTEDYQGLPENSFLMVKDHPLSTFSIDVDKASYANVRRFLNQGQLPPREAVRLEEFVNYFAYAYPQPADGEPFSVNLAAAPSPWNAGNLLLRVGLKGREVAREKRPPCNLVFLIDVSGSMEPANKLPLLKSCMKALVADLREQDRVGIVTYAGEAGIALPSTSCEQKSKILDALEALRSGGSTNGGAGIQQAYEMASSHFQKGGANRVILATDGDFNVGITDNNDLVKIISEKAKSGVFLTILGFGMGNLKDTRLEALADKGNGHYGYIDSFQEGRKMLVTEAGSTLVTIAKDVKIQIEFNPEKIQAFRLLGYENRLLAHKDFNDDKKDAGEIGAGHTVTALYELVPAGKEFALTGVDPLRYQQVPPVVTQLEPTEAAKSGEMLTVKLRYKDPEGEASKLLVRTLSEHGPSWEKAEKEFRFAAAVAAFGMILRNSPHKGDATFDRILAWAESARGKDESGDRAEFLNLVRAAKALEK